MFITDGFFESFRDRYILLLMLLLITFDGDSYCLGGFCLYFCRESFWKKSGGVQSESIFKSFLKEVEVDIYANLFSSTFDEFLDYDKLI